MYFRGSIVELRVAQTAPNAHPANAWFLTSERCPAAHVSLITPREEGRYVARVLQCKPPVGLRELGHGKQSARVATHGAPLPLTYSILTRDVLADGSKMGAVVGDGFARSLY